VCANPYLLIASSVFSVLASFNKDYAQRNSYHSFLGTLPNSTAGQTELREADRRRPVVMS